MAKIHVQFLFKHVSDLVTKSRLQIAAQKQVVMSYKKWMEDRQSE